MSKKCCYRYKMNLESKQEAASMLTEAPQCKADCSGSITTATPSSKYGIIGQFEQYIWPMFAFSSPGSVA